MESLPLRKYTALAAVALISLWWWMLLVSAGVRSRLNRSVLTGRIGFSADDELVLSHSTRKDQRLRCRRGRLVEQLRVGEMNSCTGTGRRINSESIAHS